MNKRIVLFFLMAIGLVAFLTGCESEAPMPTDVKPETFPALTVAFGISSVEDYVPFAATTIATISGGSGQYHSELYGDGVMLDTVPVVIIRFDEVRVYEVSLKVTDVQTGELVEKSISVTGLATPPGLPLESWFFASPISGQVPFDVSLVGGGRGGVPPYSYEIRREDQPISTQELANLNITEVGKHHLSFKVTDAIGDSSLSHLEIRGLESDMLLTLAASLMAFPSQEEVGKQVALISQVYGGALPYHYEISVGGRLVSSESMTLYTISDLGQLMAELRVTDDAGSVAYDTVWIIGTKPYVYEPPALSVSAFAAPSRLSVGYPTTLDADVTGGVAPFRYEWSYNGQVFSHNENATFTTSQAGDYQFQVLVTDSVGQADSAIVAVTFESQGDGGEVVTWQVATDLKAGPSSKTDSATVTTGQESSWNRIWFYIKLDVQSSLRKTMTLEFVYANGSVRQWLIADVMADRPAYVLIDGGEALVEPVLMVRWYYPGGTTSSSLSDANCDNWNRVLEISGSREIPANYQGMNPISVESSFKTAIHSN